MLKIFKNIFFFKVVKTNTKKERLEKPKKEKLLFLISENTGDRQWSMCKIIKYLLNIEKKVQGVSRIKHLKRINFFNWLPILNILFVEHNNFRHFYLTLIAELFRGRSLLKNSTLITSHLTVLWTNNFTASVLLKIFKCFQINNFFKEQMNSC